MGKHNYLVITARIAVILFFLLFFLYPVLIILSKSLASLNTGSLIEIISSNERFIRNSFFQATVSTFFAVLIGLPAAYILSRKEFQGRKLVKAFSLVPFVFPSILVVLSFVFVFGNNGWINTLLKNVFGFQEHIQFLYGFSGIILAHVFYNFPLVMLFVSNAWENQDVTMKNSARTLGANRLNVFLNITLPQLLPAIIASASLVFIYCFMSFAIVITLGGLNFMTMEVEIYHLITRNIDFGAAAVLSMFQFAFLSLVVYIYLFFSRKFAIKERVIIEQREKLSLMNARGIAEAGFLAIIVLFVLVPIISLISFAFSDPKTGLFSLDNFAKIIFSTNKSLLGTTPMYAVLYSLVIAFFASVTATFFGFLASLRKDRFSLLVLFLNSSIAISIITLGFGYLLGFGSGNILVISIGHSVLAFPFAYRVINNAMKKIDAESIESARTLGASEIDVLKHVQLPRIKTSLFVSLAFSFAVSLGELGLVLILYDGIYATMPVYIYRLITTFDLHAATAMGIILIAVSFLCFYFIERLSKSVKVFA